MSRLPMTSVVVIGLIALLASTGASVRAQQAPLDLKRFGLDFKPFGPMKRYAETVAVIEGWGTVNRRYWPSDAAAREAGNFDLDAYGETARLYSNAIEPQLRAYLGSIKAVDESFRAGLGTTRNVIEVVRRDRPPSDKARQALVGALAALQTRLRFLERSRELARLAATYDASLEVQSREQMALIARRTEQAERKGRQEESRPRDRKGEERDPEGVSIPLTNYPANGWSVHDGSPPTKQKAVQDSLPSSRILHNELAALAALAPGSASALAALPSLRACIDTMKAVEGGVTGPLQEASQEASRADIRYDRLSASLSEIERTWGELMGFAATCSHSRLWSS